MSWNKEERTWLLVMKVSLFFFFTLSAQRHTQPHTDTHTPSHPHSH